MKTAIYCRLSEEDKNKRCEEDDSESIQNQKSMLIKYAFEQGWEIYDIYSDDDYAGADRKRPEFNRLISDARQRKFDIILCKTQSRFTRELELVEKYIHGLFPLWGIRFIGIVDNADTANKGNKKSRQINGLVNEWYLEDMSENIRSVLTSKRRMGLHIGSSALYGYIKSPIEKGRLIIDEKAAAVVKEVFYLFSQGHGKTAIARTLNDRGIPPPSQYKAINTDRQSGKTALWRYSTISSMLNNEIYIGNMVQGRYGSVSYKTKRNKPRPKSEWIIAENTHEPIIDKTLWDKVQALIRKRSKPFSSGTVGSLAGKVRCASCGCALCSSKCKGKRYLQCSTRRFSKKNCDGAFISYDRLERIVLEQLNRLTEKYFDFTAAEQSFIPKSNEKQRRQRLSSQLLSYRKKLSEYSKAISSLYMDKVRGIIAESDYAQLSKELHTEHERLSALVLDTENALEKFSQTVEYSESGEELIRRYVFPERLSYEIAQGMIDCIYIGKRIAGTRIVPVEIRWSF